MELAPPRALPRGARRRPASCRRLAAGCRGSLLCGALLALALCPGSAPCWAGPAAGAADGRGRRHAAVAALSQLVLPWAASAEPGVRAEGPSSPAFEQLNAVTKDAYERRDFEKALAGLTTIIEEFRPNEFEWYERRGQLLVDMKRFEKALADFETAERMSGPQYKSLGLLSNRGLAYAGIFKWQEAVDAYSQAIKAAEAVGFQVPFVLNCRGMALASLGRYEEAMRDYALSVETFQKNGQLSPAIYAQSNAALLWAQLGDESRALKEVRKVAVRAPGSVDMRAAQAALLFDAGEVAKAEGVWNDACTKINTGVLNEGDLPVDGCAQYRDPKWLEVERRWPPVMLAKMRRFLALERPKWE